MSTLRFIWDAWLGGYAFIDMDGTILKKFRLPGGDECLVGDSRTLLNGMSALEWWKANLQPTAVIKRRLPLLYLLKALGVKLIVWTNRCPQHETVTRKALGVHARLFNHMLFYDGQKGKCNWLLGPVLDDDPKYLPCGTGRGLLVKSL